jgi:hypothetical protein
MTAPDRVIQPRAEHLQLLLRRHPHPHRPYLELPVDGRHHGISAITLFQQQAAQPA